MNVSQRLADPTKILTRSELATVLADLQRRRPRSKNTRLNLIIFRLACCCGLRASETGQLQVGDVRVDQARPHLRIRRGAAKGGKAERVPLWWDAGTLVDLTAWKADRLKQVAEDQQSLLLPRCAQDVWGGSFHAILSGSGFERRVESLERNVSNS